ncbi:MAG: hypothetical protein RLZZ117_1032, partial [Cyanobacteriota bacterium]
YSLPDVRVYEGLLEEACLEAGVPFLPVLEAFLEQPRWAEWLTADGLHGNSEGHGFLFERVRRWPALNAWAGLHPLDLPTPARR